MGDFSIFNCTMIAVPTKVEVHIRHRNLHESRAIPSTFPSRAPTSNDEMGFFMCPLCVAPDQGNWTLVNIPLYPLGKLQNCHIMAYQIVSWVYADIAYAREDFPCIFVTHGPVPHANNKGSCSLE